MIRLDNIEYSFEDEIAVGFSYDSLERKIAITFESHYRNGRRIEKSCSLIVDSWTGGQSKIHGQDRYSDLERNLGVPSLLLRVEQLENEVICTINTTDDRYVVLRLVGAELKVYVH